MTATSIELWGPLLVAFVVAAAVTPAAIKIAPKIGAMDIPKDERRMHKKPMPRFGMNWWRWLLQKNAGENVVCAA